MPIPTPEKPLVQTVQELEEFRRRWFTPQRLLRALQHCGMLLISVAPGVGKTHLIDQLIARLRAASRYAVVIYLTSQKAILQARPWVKEWVGLTRREQRASDVAVLLGRPHKRCGQLDTPWTALEQAGCSLVGRAQLCAHCPARRRCSWPEQYSTDHLEGKRVVGYVQHVLSAVPAFVLQIMSKTGADSALTILDEAAFLDVSLRAQLSLPVLQISLDVLRRVRSQPGRGGRALDRHIDAHRLLLDPHASPAALEPPPRLSPDLAYRLQDAGVTMYPGSYHYLGFELLTLAYSRRWRAEDGGVDYVRRPLLKVADHIVAAAGVPLLLARHRLDEPALQEFCGDVQFLHEHSSVYNIRSRIGSARHFYKNMPQILFDVAQLIAQLATTDKRTLVVCKKRFAGLVGVELQRCLRELTGRPFRVVPNATTKQLANPLVVPLLWFGVQGINTYEGIDAAIAVCSYNARQDVLESYLNDSHRPGEEIRLELGVTAGLRVARVSDYWHAQQGFQELVDAYQTHHEACWAEQALGRVRFCTKPRLVVFFQLTPPRYPLSKEFRTLAAFRHHFGLLTRREWQGLRGEAQVRELVARGMGRRAIATELGVSLRTVHRYLRGDK